MTIGWASRIACIDKYVNSLPMKYHSLIGKGGILLSGGEKQRLLIARAVYKDPELLIMDEATNSLDANNEAEISENLSRFFLNRTVIIVAHRLNTIKSADQIIVLNDGKIIEKGTHERLTASSSYYHSLFKNQIN
ncbi:ATP-binding cassette domain-containing protein [Gaoshiqia sp. Z1-71]|uniref:ATP-binding cassette domain-containing protein n=1 Tax=Gaoshiqia hydrogeniformans TaxID=3290090 RepID=UPI003BF87085